MSRILVALVAVTSALAVAPSAFAQKTVSEAMVRAIENQMVMPRRAKELELYDRYYAYDHVSGREVIAGVYVLRKSSEARVVDGAAPVPNVKNAFTTPQEYMPPIVDGGCSVVRLYFDLTTESLIWIRNEGSDAFELGVCNGHA